MADFNYVMMTGRLTQDAEVRMTKTGKKVTNFSIAVNDDYKDGETWIPRAYFFNVLCQGDKPLTKGTQVIVEGNFTQKSVVKEGQTRNYFQIIVNKVVPFAKVKKEEKKQETQNAEYVTNEVTDDEDVPF